MNLSLVFDKIEKLSYIQELHRDLDKKFDNIKNKYKNNIKNILQEKISIHLNKNLQIKLVEGYKIKIFNLKSNYIASIILKNFNLNNLKTNPNFEVDLQFNKITNLEDVNNLNFILKFINNFFIEKDNIINDIKNQKIKYFEEIGKFKDELQDNAERYSKTVKIISNDILEYFFKNSQKIIFKKPISILSILKESKISSIEILNLNLDNTTISFKIITDTNKDYYIKNADYVRNIGNLGFFIAEQVWRGQIKGFDIDYSSIFEKKYNTAESLEVFKNTL